MTGIERLRELVDGISPITALCGVTKSSYDRSHIEMVGARLRDFLADIADQIEREQGEHVSRTRVLGVASEMERHVLGHEGMEDSPVARWARELREALGATVSRRESDGVADSPYDAIPPEDAEAVAWVRKHGGIEMLRRMFRDIDSRRVELCAALGIDLDKGWSEAMAAMRLRLMPEGMEWLLDVWPRFEDSEPLRRDDEVMTSDGAVKAEELYLTICDSDGGVTSIDFGERVKRPAPKVLAADGGPLEAGQTVWSTEDGGPYKVDAPLSVDCYGVRLLNGRTPFRRSPDTLTHRAPVLAADEKPLQEGEHVYHVETGAELVVKELPKLGEYQAVVVFAPPASHLTSFDPDQLTHERHESWERLEEDAKKDACDYFWRGKAAPCNGCPREQSDDCAVDMAIDLVRRAKKLAERSE